MDLAEHLAKLYQALATACRDRVERVPAAEDQAEELLVEAEERARTAPAPKERPAKAGARRTLQASRDFACTLPDAAWAAACKTPP